MVSFVEEGLISKMFTIILRAYLDSEYILGADLVRIWLEVWTLDLQVCKERYFCLTLHSYIKHLKGTFRFLGNGFYVKQIVESSADSGSARASYTSDELRSGGWEGGGTTLGRPVGEPALYVTTPRLSQGRSSLCCVSLKLS